MVWEKIWQLLNTPPPEITIPFLHQWVEQVESSAVKWIAEQIVALIGWLSTLLLSTPSAFLVSPEFLQVHRTVALLSLAAMLPVIGWIGLQTITGGETSGELGGSLARMMGAAALIEIAPTAVGMLINLFNNLSAILLTSLPTMSPSEILHPAGLEMGLFLFIGVYLFLVVKLVLYYAYRNYALMVLVALSPLVFLLWALPGQSGRISRWTQELTVLLTTQVVHSIQLIILVAMTVGSGGGQPGLPLLLLQIGGLMFMTKTPAWLAEYIHEAPNPLGRIPLKDLKSPQALLRRVKRAFIK